MKIFFKGFLSGIMATVLLAPVYGLCFLAYLCFNDAVMHLGIEAVIMFLISIVISIGSVILLVFNGILIYFIGNKIMNFNGEKMRNDYTR